MKLDRWRPLRPPSTLYCTAGTVNRVAKADDTRARILEVSQRLVLQQGFAGTSIDQIVAECELTKGGFFYHFRGKADLARALMQAYLEADDAFFRGLRERADELVEDPVQRLLLFLKLLAEAMGDLPGVHPGCLVASMTYESQLVDPEVRDMAAAGLAGWRRRFLELFEAAAEVRPPREEVDLGALADLLNGVLEGGIVTSRTMNDPTLLVSQILELRRYVKLLFA